MKRSVFDYELNGREGFRSKGTLRVILPAIRYGSGLIIQASFENMERKLKTLKYWHVVHAPTASRIVTRVSKRVAGLLAGVLAELPIDWSISTQREFIAHFEALPKELQQLVHKIRLEDYGTR